MKTASDTYETIQVLLVEDGPGDARLMQEVIRKSNPSVQLHVVTNGEDAMAFLRRGASHAHAPRPDLIFLDLNLPKMNGRDVLSLIKADPRLKTIPIVILTISDAAKDIHDSYQLHANCYLTKPTELDEFEELVKNINEFWLKRVKLPKRAKATE
jgi:two-component system, chemotaxis family, response regulator Rcp1